MLLKLVFYDSSNSRSTQKNPQIMLEYQNNATLIWVKSEKCFIVCFLNSHNLSADDKQIINAQSL